MTRSIWTLAFLLMAATLHASEAPSPRPAHSFDGDRTARRAREGARVSPTLRHSIDRLEASDVVVYADVRSRSVAEHGRTHRAHRGRAGTALPAVSLDRRSGPCQRIAILGHELQHAVEIADEPSVTSDRALAALYQRIGFRSVGTIRRNAFDSARRSPRASSSGARSSHVTQNLQTVNTAAIQDGVPRHVGRRHVVDQPAQCRVHAALLDCSAHGRRVGGHARARWPAHPPRLVSRLAPVERAIAMFNLEVSELTRAAGRSSLIARRHDASPTVMRLRYIREHVLQPFARLRLPGVRLLPSADAARAHARDPAPRPRVPRSPPRGRAPPVSVGDSAGSASPVAPGVGRRLRRCGLAG